MILQRLGLTSISESINSRRHLFTRVTVPPRPEPLPSRQAGDLECKTPVQPCPRREAKAFPIAQMLLVGSCDPKGVATRA